MAGVHLSEEEQSERLKQWWRENGTSVVIGVVLGIAVIGGVNWWRSYKAEQAASASALYTQIVRGGGQSVGDLARRLMDEYPGTPYAGKGALVAAKAEFEGGNADQARPHLEWAMANAEDPADRTVARLRLSRLLLDAGDLERAEELLSEMHAGGYESEYHEILGDLAMVRNDPETARTEYEAALANLPEPSTFVDMLNLKLDAAIGATR